MNRFKCINGFFIFVYMKGQLETVYKETDIEILISTMNRDSLDFLVPMFSFLHFSDFSIVVINQTKKDQLLVSNYPNIRVFNSFDTGLSKSRNIALKNATGKILLIADDDVIYQDGFLSKIVASHNEYKDAAAILFSATQSNGSFLKKYPLVTKTKMSSFDILNTSSIEITLKKNKIESLEIEFDDNFGLGSTFEMGEEAIFLFDVKNKKEQLVFVPEVIVSHDSNTTTKKRNILENYYIQGALFTRIFRNKHKTWIFIKVFFDLKQQKIKWRMLNKILKIAQEGHLKYKLIK